jgi:gamma-glutamyltranspeptidase/glutathione hydrolase
MRDFQLRAVPGSGDKRHVCASHPLAAKTAINILEQGGGLQWTLQLPLSCWGVYEPQMTGIGGDCFVLYSPRRQ